MIGGRRTRKNAVGENTSSRSKTAVFTEVQFKKNPIKAPKHTVTLDSGKYWKCVCSIK